MDKPKDNLQPQASQQAQQAQPQPRVLKGLSQEDQKVVKKGLSNLAAKVGQMLQTLPNDKK